MSFSLLHKLVAYLLSGMGLFALSLGTELEDWALVCIAIAFVGSYFAEGELLARPHYARGWTAAVVAALAIQVFRGLSAEPTLAMAMEFAAFLQISRLFNRRTATDYQQIAVLAFLHLIAATVLSSELTYALIFIGFVIATPWMLALSHLRREIEGNYPASVDGDEQARTAIRRVLASKRVVGPSFLLGTAMLAVPLFIMTLAIFVVIPRVGKGFLTFQRGTGQQVAGFGNQIELGGFGVIRDDPTVVLRVTPMPREQARGERAFRMRGTSFDRYDGRRWTRSPSATHSLPRERVMRYSGYHYPLRRPARAFKDKRFQIVLDHLEEPVVFVPSGAIAISVPPRVEDGERRPRQLVHNAGLDIRYFDPNELGLIYSAYLPGDPKEGRDVQPLLPEDLQSYLQIPPGHGRIVELARRVTRDAAGPLDKAKAIDDYLKAGRFQYTLEQPTVTPEQRPLDVFLFDAKRGHCEYFSSAMAIMLRGVGVPTRNVTGFVGGRYNPYGDYYALRQGDAHSWVEVYVEGRGWVTFDPTPPLRGAMGPKASLWSDLNALIDALRTRWTTSVVGYDLRTQVGMLRDLARWLASKRGPKGDAAAQNDEDGGLSWFQKLRDRRLLWLLPVLAVGAFLWWRRRRGGGDAPRPVSENAARAVRLYQELERQLARKGHPRPPSVTPYEHARALSDQGFAESEAVLSVTRGYVEARYGERPLTAADLARLEAALGRVRQSPRADATRR